MLFALAAVHWGLTLRLPPHLLLFVVLVVVSAIDLEDPQIPDLVVFPVFRAVEAVTGFVSMALGTPGALVAAAVGAAAYSAGLLAVHLLNPSGLGFGDVKAALLLGWYLGGLPRPPATPCCSCSSRWWSPAWPARSSVPRCSCGMGRACTTPSGPGWRSGPWRAPPHIAAVVNRCSRAHPAQAANQGHHLRGAAAVGFASRRSGGEP